MWRTFGDFGEQPQFDARPKKTPAFRNAGLISLMRVTLTRADLSMGKTRTFSS
jgi:hypothetical protein